MQDVAGPGGATR